MFTDQNVCSGAEPMPINSIAAATAADGLTASYRWQYRMGDGEWMDHPQSANEETLSPTIEGDTTYYRRVAFAEGCDEWKATEPVAILLHPEINIEINAPSSICAGEPTFIEVEGPADATYVWSTEETATTISVRPTEETSYSVTVTAASGCTQTAEVTLMVMSTEPITEETAIICAGEELTLNSNGGMNYEWRENDVLIGTTASIAVSPTSDTQYELTTVSENGCVGRISYPVTVLPAIELTFSQTNPSCDQTNGSIELNNNGSINGNEVEFSLSDNAYSSTTIFENLAVGTYTIQARYKDYPDCASTVSIELVEEDLASGDSCDDGDDHTINDVILEDGCTCQGEEDCETSTVDRDGDGTPDCKDDCPDNPELSEPGLCGCGEVSVVEALVVTDSSHSETAAKIMSSDNFDSIEKVNLQASEQIRLEPGFRKKAQEDHRLRAHIGYEVTVSYNSIAEAGIISGDQTVCSGEELQPITNVEAAIPKTGFSDDDLIYSWQCRTPETEWIDFEGSTNTTSIMPTVKGPITYFRRVVEVEGCGEGLATDSITIEIHPPVEATARPDTIINKGETIELIATGGGTYLWSTNETSAKISVSPADTTIYTVTVTNEAGCMDIAMVRVDVIMPIDTMHTQETLCDDGIDNDGDGLIDCLDGDCEAALACNTEDIYCEIIQLIQIKQEDYNKLNFFFMEQGDMEGFKARMSAIGTNLEEVTNKVQDLSSLQFNMDQYIPAFDTIYTDTLYMRLATMKENVADWEMSSYTKIPLIGDIDFAKKYELIDETEEEQTEECTETVNIDFINGQNDCELTLTTTGCSYLDQNGAEQNILTIDIEGGTAPYTITIGQLNPAGVGDKFIVKEIIENINQGSRTLSVEGGENYIVTVKDSSPEPCIVPSAPSNNPYEGPISENVPDEMIDYDFFEMILERLQCTGFNLEDCISISSEDYNISDVLVEEGMEIIDLLEGNEDLEGRPGEITLTVIIDGEIITMPIIRIFQDGDEDGVNDAIDLCPDVSGSDTAHGCPDMDGDGVSDEEDACMEIAGTVYGCPDDDGDGFVDMIDEGIPDGIVELDLCPDESGTVNGCPDIDEDGVPDKDDECIGGDPLEGTISTHTAKSDGDGDGLPNELEDADGDGDWRNDDTDEDGIPNFLDEDDDNDGETSADELLDENGNPDSDGDGILNPFDPQDDQATEVNCTDRIDNDGDGLVDCEDPDCQVASEIQTTSYTICKVAESGLRTSTNSSSRSTSCSENDITLSIEITNQHSSVDVEWSTGSSELSTIINTPGIYTVSITNDLGCVEEKSISIVETYCLELDNQAIDYPLCEGESVELSIGTGYDSYEWSTQEIGNTITVSETGIYTVEVRDVIGCYGKLSIIVYECELGNCFGNIADCSEEELPQLLIWALREAAKGSVAAFIDFLLQLGVEYWLGGHPSLEKAYENLDVNKTQLFFSFIEGIINDDKASTLLSAANDAISYLNTNGENSTVEGVFGASMMGALSGYLGAKAGNLVDEISKYLITSPKETIAKLKSLNVYERFFDIPSFRNHVFDAIELLPKNSRPEPENYLTSKYITRHLDNFIGKASFLIHGNNYNDFIKNSDFIGRADGQFVSTASEIDEVLLKANGDISIIEKELGIDAGEWQGENGIWRVDIHNFEGLDLRLPSGKEAGANENWIPGGQTSGGALEAVMNPIPNNSEYITITKVI